MDFLPSIPMHFITEDREMIDYKKVFELIDERKDEYVELLRELCDIESPSSFKAGVDAVGEYLIKIAKERGWRVQIHREEISGNAVCFTMNPDVEARSVCFSGHMDTVHPVGSFGYPPTRIEGDAIFGPGATDCKGGIVASFMAMTALEDAGYTARPLKLIMQSDEEVGSSTSEKRTVKFMAEMASDAVAFLNAESFGAKIDNVVVERKGIIRFQFDITGVAVHSANCFNGANAVLEAAHKIIELEKWKEEGGITCNCGVINGGTTPNTVAEKCTFFADIRYLTAEELEMVNRRVREIADTVYVEGCRTNLTVKSYRINMEKNEKNLELLDKMNDAYEKCGFERLTGSMARGGSDAADMTSYGIPTLDSLGVCGGYIHSTKEYAFISSLPEVAKRFAAVALYIED